MQKSDNSYAKDIRVFLFQQVYNSHTQQFASIHKFTTLRCQRVVPPTWRRLLV